MPMTEDMTVFFNVGEHATAATYKTTTVKGIFENQYVEVNGVQSVKPTFLTAVDSVPGIVRGNKILIENISYTFIFHQPDGTGLTLLVLEAPN